MEEKKRNGDTELSQETKSRPVPHLAALCCVDFVGVVARMRALATHALKPGAKNVL